MSTIIDDGIWTDPWMQSISTVPKLLFFYLWTNDHRNLACLYEISIRTISNETGLLVDEIDAALSNLEPKVLYDKEGNICWVKSFVKRQFLRYGHISPKIVSGITKNLIALPQAHPFIFEFLEFYPELNISYPYVADKPKKEKQPKEKPVVTEAALYLAEHLSECVRQNRVDRKLSPPKDPDLTKWAIEFDFMMRRDGRSHEDIRRVIDWCQKDDFWWKNILSPSKLRDKFERLEADMVSRGSSGPRKEAEPDDPYKGVPVIGGG